MVVDTNNCFNENGIKYCPILGTSNCIVGDNSSSNANAVVSGHTFTKLHIHSKIKSYKIVELGNYAFYYHTTIQTVRLDEGITQISQATFYGLKNLELIVLPSSLEIVLDWGISGYNGGTSPCTLVAIFLPDSQLKSLTSGGIERYNKVIIYYCGYGTPSYKIYPFYHVNEVVLYSFHQFEWNGHTTIVNTEKCLSFLQHRETIRSLTKIQIKILLGIYLCK